MPFYYPYGDYQPRGIQDWYSTNKLITPMNYQGNAHGFHHHPYNPSFGWPLQYQQGQSAPQMHLPYSLQTFSEPLELRGVHQFPSIGRGIWLVAPPHDRAAALAQLGLRRAPHLQTPPVRMRYTLGEAAVLWFLDHGAPEIRAVHRQLREAVPGGRVLDLEVPRQVSLRLRARQRRHEGLEDVRLLRLERRNGERPQAVHLEL
ncbi:hypothetical protein PG984_005340 [Apiospora sp. TS-2023a]